MTSNTSTLASHGSRWYEIIPFILLLLVAVVIAVATFVEHASGTALAHRLIYDSWAFCVLWGAVAVSGAWLLWRRRLWHRLPVLLIHVALLLILAGALTTHLTHRRGMTHLRQGEATSTYWTTDADQRYTQSRQLPFFLALREFRTVYAADSITPIDYVSEVLIATRSGERPVTISMNHIARAEGYRIYQTSFDDDGLGSTFTISYDPWGTPITYVGYLLLALSMMWTSVNTRSRACADDKPASRLTTVLLAICGTVMASYMVVAICLKPLVPVLRSPYLFFHVGTILLSYILLVVSLVRRQVLRAAVFFLATGIFLGAVWANVSWGSYWSWDPKESWALITLIVYSLPLHSQSLPWFRSQRHYRIYSLLALLSLLMTYFGVNFLLGGMHSYA